MRGKLPKNSWMVSNKYVLMYLKWIYFNIISENFQVKNKFITNKINSQSDKRITKKDEIGFTYGMYIFFSYFVMNQFFGAKISQASRDFSLTYSAQSFRKYISRLVNYELKLFLETNLYFGATKYIIMCCSPNGFTNFQSKF